MSDNPRFPPNLIMVISVIAVSTASILIRWSNAPPIIIAFYRMTISVLILLPFFLRDKGPQKLAKLKTRDIYGLMGVGIALALHFASWITSLSMTTVASSVIFVHIDPIIVALLSHLILKERVNRRVTAGILISLAGVSIIAINDAGTGQANLIGDQLALMGGIMLGLYLFGGRVFRKDLSLTTYVTPVYTTASVVLLFMAVIQGVPLSGYPLKEYQLFTLIALVPMIFGHTLYNWALRYVSAPIVSVSLLGEPIGASILAFLFLNEVPSSQTVFGGLITLAGILLSVHRSN